jgi:nucleolar protein 56
MATYVLYECAAGYCIFELINFDKIGEQEVQSSVTDLQRFSKYLKLTAFQPFESAEDALANVNAVSEGIVDESLLNFLSLNLPKVSKKAGKKQTKFTLGVVAPNLAQSIKSETNIKCRCDETIREVTRGIRVHLSHFIQALGGNLMRQSQLGLSHSYSRAKVKFNINRSDNMIIQAIALLDQMDKDLNTFAMRVREWYSWHFPELLDYVNNNFQYTKVIRVIGDRNQFNESHLGELTKLVLDEDLAKRILAASKMSMGMDISKTDLHHIDLFASKVVSLQEYRQQLFSYLQAKMAVVAPNLAALIGEVVAARLIAHAGSLTNLAKCPASTVQILGAEKALFRALKTKGNTPKYGLIFHSTFIGRATAKNKGRISRYLANKCAMSARIDAFCDFITAKYGQEMNKQVEERLNFYATGATPRKNITVMSEAAAKVAEQRAAAEAASPSKKKRKKSSTSDAEASAKKKAKKDKKKKKKKKKKD